MKQRVYEMKPFFVMIKFNYKHISGFEKKLNMYVQYQVMKNVVIVMPRGPNGHQLILEFYYV